MLSMFGSIGFRKRWYPVDGLDPNQSRDIRVYSGKTPKAKLSLSETPNSSVRCLCLVELNFG
jgi:hypothetical protein